MTCFLPSHESAFHIPLHTLSQLLCVLSSPSLESPEVDVLSTGCLMVAVSPHKHLILTSHQSSHQIRLFYQEQPSQPAQPITAGTFIAGGGRKLDGRLPTKKKGVNKHLIGKMRTPGYTTP